MENSAKFRKVVNSEEEEVDETRINTIIERAKKGLDISNLLISTTGHHVEPSTPSNVRQKAPPAIHLASHCGDIEAVKALLSVIPVTDLAEEGGPRHWLPICYAVHMGHLEVVQLLKDHGSPLRGEKQLMECAISGGQLNCIKWIVQEIDINEHPQALKSAIECDIPRTLTTILSLSKLTSLTLNKALQWAVLTGSVMRMNHLLQFGASVYNSEALFSSVSLNNTLITHKLLCELKPDQMQRFGDDLLINAAKNKNVEMMIDLLAHNASVSADFQELLLDLEMPLFQKVRVLVALLKYHKVLKGKHEAITKAQKILDKENVHVDSDSNKIIGKIEGKEKEFVADKPVKDPKHFACTLKGNQTILIGRSDPSAQQQVDIDLSEVSSCASVSRAHVEVRKHPHWQIKILGRNGVYDPAVAKFFPPSDFWLDVADCFTENKFEVSWVVFHLTD